MKPLLTFIKPFQKIIDEKEEQIQDLDKEGDELKALLSQATSRADEKELLIFEMEEKLETLNVQLEEYKSGRDIFYCTFITIIPVDPPVHILNFSLKGLLKVYLIMAL